MTFIIIAESVYLCLFFDNSIDMHKEFGTFSFSITLSHAESFFSQKAISYYNVISFSDSLSLIMVDCVSTSKSFFY